MPQCVKWLPSGSQLGLSAGNLVINFPDLLVKDSACASGLMLYTQSEISALVVPATTDVQLSVDSSSDPQRVADMQLLFYAFLGVLVAVWGVKQLLNLFSGDTSRD